MYLDIENALQILIVIGIVAIFILKYVTKKAEDDTMNTRKRIDEARRERELKMRHHKGVAQA